MQTPIKLSDRHAWPLVEHVRQVRRGLAKDQLNTIQNWRSFLRLDNRAKKGTHQLGSIRETACFCVHIVIDADTAQQSVAITWSIEQQPLFTVCAVKAF